MSKQLTLSILLLTAIAFSSCKNTVIEGKVLDGFGKPVKDATVKVDGTQFTAQTDGDGEYSVGYVPGDIKVLISKQGFTDTTFTVKISTEATFPAEATTIFEIPNGNGVFLMQDGKYNALSKATVSQQTYETGDVWFKRQSIVFYVDYDNEKVFTIKKGTAQFVFFDNDPNNQTLFKVLNSNDGRRTLMQRNLSNGGLGFAMGDYSDNAEVVKETYRLFPKNNSAAIRNVTLDLGDYVFAPYNKRSSNAIQGDCYVIRVTN